MTKFFEESWTNSIGQKLLPGDKVITVASGYGNNTHIRTATYLGVRKDEKGIVTGVTVQYLTAAYKWRTRDIGKKSSLPSKRVFRIS